MIRRTLALVVPLVLLTPNAALSPVQESNRLGMLRMEGRDLVYRSTFGPSGELALVPHGTRRWLVLLRPEKGTAAETPTVRLGVLRAHGDSLLYRSSRGPFGELSIVPEVLVTSLAGDVAGKPELRGWRVAIVDKKKTTQTNGRPDRVERAQPQGATPAAPQPRAQATPRERR